MIILLVLQTRVLFSFFSMMSCPYIKCEMILFFYRGFLVVPEHGTLSKITFKVSLSTQKRILRNSRFFHCFIVCELCKNLFQLKNKHGVYFGTILQTCFTKIDTPFRLDEM